MEQYLLVKPRPSPLFLVCSIWLTDSFLIR